MQTPPLEKKMRCQWNVCKGRMIKISILDTFTSKLHLKNKQLDTLLDLEPTGHGQVPYHGYVELHMRVPNV